MKHIGLFEGIGGFSIAARRMGWETVAWCEWNEFGQRVLKYHFPEAEGHGDITKTDFTKYANQIDIITGGFPCQPYSTAGKRLGKEDERHLWPEMLRAIREVKPTWVVGENVLGLVNWNGGLVFDEVQADLEAQGYEVQPYVLPACAVDAPHRRDRVWFVAYNAAYANKRTERSSRKSRSSEENRSENNDEQEGWGKQAEQHIGRSSILRAAENANSIRRNCVEREVESQERGQREFGSGDNERVCGEERLAAETTGEGREDREQIDGRSYSEENGPGLDNRPERLGSERTVAHANNIGLCDEKQIGQMGRKRFGEHNIGGNWAKFPTQSPICSGDDGIPRELDGITFSKWRQESIKAYGNAIVPQVAYQIFKSIEKYQLL